MNFPHPALRQTAVNSRNDHNAMLATAIARQANSRTARAMVVAATKPQGAVAAERDIVGELIHYFGSDDRSERSPSGAFLATNYSQEADEKNTESGVYQNASTNIKAHDLFDGGTGEQSNLAGRASRTLC